jgi:hypothetical protein
MIKLYSKTREMDGGEEVIEYVLGPRGKIEVGTSGVAGLVPISSYGRRFDPKTPPKLPFEILELFPLEVSQSLDGPRDVPLPRRKTKKKKMMILKSMRKSD